MDDILKTPLYLEPPLQNRFDNLLEDAKHAALVARLWNRDYLIWREDPTEISNRLGWLKSPSNLLEEFESLTARVAPLIEEGPSDCVLLGMGGSSLCAEVLSSIVGSAPGKPHFHVLDSTCPAWVERVSNSIDLKKTLFIVASKSGGTIEVMSTFKYFWERVSSVSENPGSQFIAVTDPDTSLSALAKEKKFQGLFENDPNIGGRFSVLSYFGMVPAFLMGADVASILGRGIEFSHATKEESPAENPGVVLGAYLSACALEGRDKLTLLSSPRLERLGLWIEQLIAESTGKEGKGILPVATEPVLPETYGADRCFVVTLEEGDTSLDPTLESLKKAGHPVLVIPFQSNDQLGMEFYRWEFATAVAGFYLGIHPFDQPNVQLAKTRSGEVMDSYKKDGSLPSADSTHSFPAILESGKPGSYFAIHCYTDETPALEAALQELRKVVMKKHGFATTSGYGPRFLHSTGQYHKGGPNSGLFLQVVQGDMAEIPIPGDGYDFATLCLAQSIGDLEALKEQGRKVARVNIEGDLAAAIRQMASQV